MRLRVALDHGTGVPEHLPRTAVAEPGSPVGIGSGTAATLCAPLAATLAAHHATVVCWDDGCRVFDLAGAGLDVDGALVHEAPLAGTHTVRVEGVTVHVTPESDAAESAPAPPTPAAASAAAEAALPSVPRRALAVLRAAPGALYAVVDGARRGAALAWARAAQEPMAPLPDDATARDYADAAPHLVRLAPESALLARLLAVAWGNAECVFLTSERPFAEVRAFLRDLMDAELADGQPVLFRFYDPVVLARVRASPAVEAAAFFGVVSGWYVEAPADGGTSPAAGAPHAEADDVDRGDWAAPPADAAERWAAADGPDARPEPVALAEFRARTAFPLPPAAPGPVVRVGRRVHLLDVGVVAASAGEPG